VNTAGECSEHTVITGESLTRSGLKDEKLIKKQTYRKTETRKLYCSLLRGHHDLISTWTVDGKPIVS